MKVTYWTLADGPKEASLKEVCDFELTSCDVNQGIPGSPSRCAVACALRRVLPTTSDLCDMQIQVYPSPAYFSSVGSALNNKGEVVRYFISGEKLEAFIAAFDAKEPLEEFLKTLKITLWSTTDIS